jgi:hypothetical protein
VSHRTTNTANANSANIRPSKAKDAARREPSAARYYDVREWAARFGVSTQELRRLVGSYLQAKVQQAGEAGVGRLPAQLVQGGRHG